MPIRINLLAESFAQEEQRRKDPVKRAVWIAGFVVFLAVLWTLRVQGRLMAARSELARDSAAFTAIEKKSAVAIEENRAIGDIEVKLNALSRYSTNRFLWGSALHAVQTAITDDIQFTRLRMSQNFRNIEGEPPRKSGGKTIPGKPGGAVETVTITVDAKDYARPADQNYNRLKASLTTNSFFSQFLKGTDGFKLSSVSQPVADPVEPGKQFIAFTVDAVFPEVQRDE
jgi:hypothetical protein